MAQKKYSRKTNSTAIGSASDVGGPHRSPKSYRPATSTQKKIIAAATLAAIPGARQAVSARAVALKMAKGKTGSTNIRSTAQNKKAIADKSSALAAKPAARTGSKLTKAGGGRSYANTEAKAGVKSGQLPGGGRYASKSVTARKSAVPTKPSARSNSTKYGSRKK